MANPSLAVWKFASCDGCQLTLLDCEDELLTLAGQVTSPPSPRRPARWSVGPTTCPSWRAPSPPPPTSGASTRSATSQRYWWPSVPAPPRAAFRRCATSPTSTSSPRSSTRTEVHRHAGHVHTGFCPRHRRLRVAWVPDRPPPVAGYARRVAGRAQAAPARRDRVHRVQTARGDVCDRRRGHPMPGSGDPCRLWRAVPDLPPRLLRMLRPRCHTQHARLHPVAAA